MTQLPGGEPSARDEDRFVVAMRQARARRRRRTAALAAAVLVALGVAGYLVVGTGGDSDRATVLTDSVPPPPVSDPTPPEPLMTGPSPTPPSTTAPSGSASVPPSPAASGAPRGPGGPGPTPAGTTKPSPGPGPGRGPDPGTGAGGGEPAPTRRLDRTVADDRITESSGLAVSGRHGGVLWTHNDSGDRPFLYAIGTDGSTRARFAISGASAADWEALAPGRVGGSPALYIGDIGDNGSSRADVSVYRVTEPQSLRDGTLPATRYRLRYPDGAHDAETLLVHPDTQRIYIVTKSADRAIYAAPSKLSTTGINRLTKVADAPEQDYTDGAFLPDGRIVLRDYTRGYVAPDLDGPWQRFELPSLRQAESLAAHRSGRGVYVGSEGTTSPIWTAPVP